MTSRRINKIKNIKNSNSNTIIPPITTKINKYIGVELPLNTCNKIDRINSSKTARILRPCMTEAIKSKDCNNCNCCKKFKNQQIQQQQQKQLEFYQQQLQQQQQEQQLLSTTTWGDLLSLKSKTKSDGITESNIYSDVEQQQNSPKRKKKKSTTIAPENPGALYFFYDSFQNLQVLYIDLDTELKSSKPDDKNVHKIMSDIKQTMKLLKTTPTKAQSTLTASNKNLIQDEKNRVNISNSSCQTENLFIRENTASQTECCNDNPNNTDFIGFSNSGSNQFSMEYQMHETYEKLKANSDALEKVYAAFQDEKSDILSKCYNEIATLKKQILYLQNELKEVYASEKTSSQIIEEQFKLMQDEFKTMRDIISQKTSELNAVDRLSKQLNESFEKIQLLQKSKIEHNKAEILTKLEKEKFTALQNFCEIEMNALQNDLMKTIQKQYKVVIQSNDSDAQNKENKDNQISSKKSPIDLNKNSKSESKTKFIKNPKIISQDSLLTFKNNQNSGEGGGSSSYSNSFHNCDSSNNHVNYDNQKKKLKKNLKLKQKSIKNISNAKINDYHDDDDDDDDDDDSECLKLIKISDELLSSTLKNPLDKLRSTSNKNKSSSKSNIDYKIKTTQNTSQINHQGRNTSKIDSKSTTMAAKNFIKKFSDDDGGNNHKKCDNNYKDNVNIRFKKSEENCFDGDDDDDDYDDVDRKYKWKSKRLKNSKKLNLNTILSKNRNTNCQRNISNSSSSGGGVGNDDRLEKFISTIVDDDFDNVYDENDDEDYDDDDDDDVQPTIMSNMPKGLKNFH